MGGNLYESLSGIETDKSLDRNTKMKCGNLYESLSGIETKWRKPWNITQCRVAIYTNPYQGLKQD